MTINPTTVELLVTQAQRIDPSAAEKEVEPCEDSDDPAQHQKQLEILDLFGTVDFNPDYDYKKNRQLDRIECEP